MSNWDDVKPTIGKGGFIIGTSTRKLTPKKMAERAKYYALAEDEIKRGGTMKTAEALAKELASEMSKENLIREIKVLEGIQKISMWGEHYEHLLKAYRERLNEDKT